MPADPALLPRLLCLQIRHRNFRCGRAFRTRSCGEAGAVEKYLGFLKSGGSKFPLETLRDAGVDMTTAEPINRTIALFEKRLGELEALL